MKGLTAPLAPEGLACKVERHDREDYVGTELVQTDLEGRPGQSVETTRDEGTDLVVLAPTAQAKAD